MKTTVTRYRTKQAIIEALDNQDEKALINLLDEYKGSYSVKTVLEILLDRQAGFTLNSVLDILNKF